MRKILFLLLILTPPIAQAQDPNVITADDIARIQQVGQVQITPDGLHIYYTISVPADPRVENALPSNHLYRYDVETQEHTALISNTSLSNLAIRPNHNSLTFTTKPEDSKNTAIYELTAQGNTLELVASYGNSISSYSWSPDGNKLIFIAREYTEPEPSPLPYQPEIYEEGLATNAAFIFDTRTKAIAQLPFDQHCIAAAWSPAGDRIAIRMAPTSLVDDNYTSQTIYIIGSEDPHSSTAITHKGKKGAMAWAPGGEHLAFIAGEDQHDPIDGRLFLSDKKGGAPTVVDPGFPGAFEALNWKDGNTLLFLASKGTGAVLGNYNPGDTPSTFLETGELAIQSFSTSSKGRIAFVASSAQHPSELFLMESSKNAPTRITDLNPWLQEKALGKQEVITYKATDGTVIEGLLIHPVSQNGPVPMITVVHGGPEAHYNNGWLTAYSMPGQMAAGNGYAVFYPNYRGSTGRGTDFAKSSQGDPGGKEFDDIIDGIDYLAEHHNIDKDRVGVTGGSYGGYATAWMSTRHTERFAAGVMFVGISNNLSKWGTSDIPEEMFLVHSRKRIWDDYEFFLKRSPIYYAGQAKTPLLIMHGKNDTRVDPGQSYELYRHIKTRTDTPVRMVLYPGEGHGNRKATARYDYSLRMMRWFDHYLLEKQEELPEMEEQLLFKN